ncbi:hypothetical protein SAMN05444487_104199 [Marininema mesophilum]|uniref:Uncharacterized protein n=1 Tax=Marininema mesophilum TaxID=1048340 RepID=A0A1H2UTA9_9BACL|nr:hypothetical protein [Marininema mesophilum]SDW58839.1 hypothetical protein SAMN05444487_104199 [Marininema mesophilum]
MLNLGRRLFASIFLSVMVISLLSLIPAIQEQGENRGDVPAFRSGNTLRLTETNLVDLLSERSTTLRLQRVEWENGNLSLSLSSSEARKKLDRDLLTLIRFLLVDTSNVDRLTMEVEGRSENFSLKASRGDLARDPGMKRASSAMASQYLTEMFRVTNHGGS